MNDLAVYFDKIADEFNGYYTGQRPTFVQEIGYRVFRAPGLQKRFSDTVRIIGNCKGVDILDVGCGPGLYTQYFAKNGARVTAMDISPNMLELARRNLSGAGIENFNLILGDFLRYEFKNTFDYTLAIGVFDYISREQRGAYFNKLRQVTKKKIIATFPRRFVFQTPIRRALFFIKKQPVFFYTTRMIKDIAERHNLKACFHNSGPIWTAEFTPLETPFSPSSRTTVSNGVYKTMRRLVVIPAYNEEENIGSVIRKIKEYSQEVDILVVDDGSSDKTAHIAKDNGAILIKHPYNMGYGATLQTGYKYADKNKYDFVVQIDGDGQHDPKYIKDLFKEIENKSADVIIGSRFLSNTRYKAPLNRMAGIVLFSKLVSLIVKQRITDSTSGFQALNKKAFRFLTGDLYPCDYPDADVIIMLHRAGFKIKEIPLVMYRKNNSKSMHSGFKPLYYGFKMILSIFVTLLRKDYNLEKEGE